MSENPTRKEVRASIVPRSDQLNAEDLLTGPITVTVAGVRRGNNEQPILVDMAERDRPFKPCKTCRRVLIALWTEEPAKWIGQQMTLFTDPSVLYAGVKVGGIRISHATGISEPKTLLLAITRGKRKETTIYPIEAVSGADQTYITDAKDEIASAETTESLKAIGFILKKKSAAVQDALRPIYGQQQKELTEQ